MNNELRELLEEARNAFELLPITGAMIDRAGISRSLPERIDAALAAPAGDDAKDAARYRYLRDDGDGFDIQVREEGDEGEEWITGYPPAELDAAIDSAIAAGSKHE